MVVVRQDPLHAHHIALCLLRQNTVVDSQEAEFLVVVAGFHLGEVRLKRIHTIVVFFFKVGLDTGDAEISLGRRRRKDHEVII